MILSWIQRGWGWFVGAWRDIRANGRAQRQNTAENARQTIAVYLRHVDGRDPQPSWILEDAAKYVLDWTEGLSPSDRKGWEKAIEGANRVMEMGKS